MRVIKRALISIRRRAKTNILVLLVIGAVMTLVLSGIAIKNAVKTASDNAKNAISSTVDIAADVQETIYKTGTFEQIDDYLVDELDEIEHVEKVVPKLKVASHSDYQQVPISNSFFSTWSAGFGSKYQAAPTNWIQGMDDWENAVKFSGGYNELYEGVFPIESTEENPMMISLAFAELNALHVGDVMTIGVGETIVEPMNFTICGIFETVKEAESMLPITINDEKNVFYTTYEIAEQAFMLNSPDARITYASVRVVLDETENINQFISDVQEQITDIKWENYKFTSGIDTYERVTASVESVGSFATTILWLSGISAIAILTLIMILSLRARKYEIGVLLSMGETKGGVVLQMVTEVILIAILAFGISSVVSSAVARNVGDSLLESAAITAKEEDPSPYNWSPGQGKSISIQLGEEVDDYIEPISEFEVDILTAKTIVQSSIFGLLIIIVSTVVPSEIMMINKAKTLMLRSN